MLEVEVESYVCQIIEEVPAYISMSLWLSDFSYQYDMKLMVGLMESCGIIYEVCAYISMRL